MNQLKLHSEFFRRLTALDESAWTRITTRVSHLGGDSAHSLWARSDAVAEGLPRTIPSLLRTSLAVAEELLAEFPTYRSRVPTAEQIASSRLTSEQQEDVVASAELARLLSARRASHPGAVAYVQAVLGALLKPGFVETESFRELYQPLEAEIPFASLAG